MKDLAVPEFESLQVWEAPTSAAECPANEDSNNWSWQVSCVEGKEEDVKYETASSGLKVLLPWMSKQGMNLTKEQLGEQESKMDDKKSTNDDVDNKSLEVLWITW